MRGRELAVEFLTVAANRTHLANIIEALAQNHLGVERFIHAGYAAGLACLGNEEREVGSTVIDLGGVTSSAAIFPPPKAHTDDFMVRIGLTTAAHKRGNDMADATAAMAYGDMPTGLAKAVNWYSYRAYQYTEAVTAISVHIVEAYLINGIV